MKVYRNWISVNGISASSMPTANSIRFLEAIIVNVSLAICEDHDCNSIK